MDPHSHPKPPGLRDKVKVRDLCILINQFNLTQCLTLILAVILIILEIIVNNRLRKLVENEDEVKIISKMKVDIEIYELKRNNRVIM